MCCTNNQESMLHINKEKLLLGDVEMPVLENLCILELSRCRKSILKLRDYIKRLKERFIIEREIAFNEWKITRFLEKWNIIGEYLSNC